MSNSGAGSSAAELRDLLLAKALALMHDPPWKPLTVSGMGKAFCNKRSRSRIFVSRSRRRHEIDASILAECVLDNVLLEAYGERLSTLGRSLRRWLSRVVRLADRKAASFDRFITSMAQYVFRRRESLRYLLSPIVLGLFNIFRPGVSALPPTPGATSARLWEYVDNFIIDLRRRLAKLSCPSSSGEDIIREAYHVLSVIYEPLWHEKSGGKIWGAADTRVPHHSVFDHVYASAAALNLLAGNRSGKDGALVVSGFLVHIGWRGLWEWIRSSRKLSDAWVASWLATAMTWYAIKDIVWCLGPDILLIPGFRWNQFYLSLLRERLGEKFDEVAGDVARNYYFWEGFPYYAWQPSDAVLLLPFADLVSESGCGELGDVIGACGAKSTCLSGAGAVAEAAARLEKYLRKRLEEAWQRVVEAVMEAVSEVFGEGEAAELMKKAVGLVEDVPPMEPAVTVLPVFHIGKKGGYLTRIGERVVHASNEVEWLKGIVEGLPEHVIDILKKRLDSGRWPNLGEDYLAKFLYALAFYHLVARVGKRRLRPPMPGWARLYVDNKKLSELKKVRKDIRNLYKADDRDGEKPWRSCTVCRRGMAVLEVPGRDLEDGDVSDDYKEFASKLCGDEGDKNRCWRVWRPVFRPGERLCPHCLIKRLAGLPQVYAKVGHSLIGYEPPKEVRFPSTDDVAALAAKISLIELAKILLAIENNRIDDSELDDFEKAIANALMSKAEDIKHLAASIGKDVAQLPTRSPAPSARAELAKGILNEKPDLKDELLTFMNKRWWTPILLWSYVRRLEKLVRKVDRVPPYIASLVLAADYEFYDMLRHGEGIAAELREIGEQLNGLAKEPDAGAGNYLRAMAESLTRPRLYHGIVRFDIDSVGDLLLGIIKDAGNGGAITPTKYLKELASEHKRALDHSPVRCNERVRKSVKFMLEYLASGCGLEIGDPYIHFMMLTGASNVVSPSYHYAISNSISYTLLRTAIVTQRLGGIPVFIGGDEGLILAPSWLPWELVPRGASEGYRKEVARAIQEVRDDLHEKIAPNPAAVIAALIPRLMWASGATYPGFHPVKKRGVGDALFRIPALIGTTVSVGLRYSHYRDHLYAEIAVSEALLRQAKQQGNGVTASMGRLNPAAPREALKSSAVVRSAPKEGWLRGAGGHLAKALVMASLLSRGRVPRSLVRAHHGLFREYEEVARLLRTDPELTKRTVQYLIERHAEGDDAELLEKLMSEESWEEYEELLRLANILTQSMERAFIRR